MAIKRIIPYIPYIFFIGITLVILLPLLSPGFILTLDMVFTPHIPLPSQVTSSYLFYALLHLINMVLPGDVIQKMVLISIFLLSGIGMFRLVRQYSTQIGLVAPYVAGLFYMINPFVYSRLMAGQFAVLLGYACLPFFLKSFLRLISRPSWQSMAWMAAWLTIIGIVSIHTLAACLLIILAGVGLTLWMNRQQLAKSMPVIQMTVIAGAVAAIFGSYWIIPLVMGRNMTAQAVAGFTSADQAAFATVGDTIVGQVINIAGLQGFWVESRFLYELPQDVIAVWPLLTLGIWALVAYGLWVMWHSQHRLVVAILCIAGLGGGLLATSLAAPLFSSLPLAMGLREPHKLVGLVALMYAVFIGFGAAALITTLRTLYKKQIIPLIALVAFFLLPFGWTPTMLGGMYGQLSPRSYPRAWYEVDSLLSRDSSQFTVLFLPWHGYQYFEFAGRIIATPADKFFTRPTLVSNELEFKGAQPTFPDPMKREITAMLPDAVRRGDLAARLAGLNIKYIIVSKEETEISMKNQPDMQLIYTSSSLRLYKNMAFGS